MQLSDIINQADSLAKSAKKELQDIIDRASDFDLAIPDFKEIQNKKVLYTNYGRLIQFQNDIARSIVRSSKLIQTLREIKNSLINSKAIQYTQAQVFIKSISSNLDDLKSLQSVIMSYKDSLEYTLKFYNSIQFILGSMRLSEYND